MTASVRVALIVEGPDTHAWVRHVVEKILAAGEIEIALMVVLPIRDGVAHIQSDEGDSGRRRAKPLGARLLSRVGRLVGAVSRRIDKALIDRRAYERDALEVVGLADLLPSVPWLVGELERCEGADALTSEDVETIRRHRPDVLVRLGFRPLCGDVLGAAPCGVWSYYHGKEHEECGGAPVFWESALAWPCTAVGVRVQTPEQPEGKVLTSVVTTTNVISVRDNTSACLWTATGLVPRKLEQLGAVGRAEFMRRLEGERTPALRSNPSLGEPSNMELALITARRLARKAVRVAVDSVSYPQWCLMYRFDSSLPESLRSFQWIVPPRDRFWADPFPIERDERYYVFFEEYEFSKGKGHISVMELRADGSHTEPVPVLERPVHLSYPFLFEHQGHLYMVPESCEARSIDLYVCDSFPYEWRLVRSLIQGIDAVDSTLLFHEDRWWMFAGVACTAGGPYSDELHLFSSDDLLGMEWTPHPQNPVVGDCRRARPAGRVFCHGGELYRPSQNCAGRYGYGFNFNRIDQLDENAYAETLIRRVVPDFSCRALATHTFNRSGALAVSDLQIRRWRPMPSSADA